MFFHLSMNYYALLLNPVLLQATGRLNIMSSVLGVPGHRIVMFGVVEFCAGWLLDLD